MKKELQLWNYLVKKCKPLKDNNFIARKIFDYVSKKLFLIIFLITATLMASAQTLPVKNKFGTPLLQTKEAGISKVHYQTTSVQLSFTSVTHEKTGWQLGNPIFLGQSYIFATGNGSYNSDTSIKVEQQFFWGFGYNIGVIPNASNNLDKGNSSITAGLIGGWDKLSIFGGYDFVGEKVVIGLNVSIVGLPILQSLTKFTQYPK